MEEWRKATREFDGSVEGRGATDERRSLDGDHADDLASVWWFGGVRESHARRYEIAMATALIDLWRRRDASQGARVRAGRDVSRM